VNGTSNVRQKMTILPLHSASHNLLADHEVFDLGYGITVEHCKELLASSDLWIWNHKRVQDDEEEINSWDTCLVHRYHSEPITGKSDESSITLMAYVLAHLRLINPHRDSVDDSVQLEEKSDGNGYRAFRCTKAAFRPNRFLSDCENLVTGIDRRHLNELKTFMPWIADFVPHWRAYHPLWISLYLIEEGYKPGHNLRALHLFRVMALEGLFCSDSSFGKKALTNRITKLLGFGVDLYEAYRVDYLELPRLELTVDLIKDIYTLRNKIAHSDSLPEVWQNAIVRTGLQSSITYLVQLLEAATSIARLSWLKIIKDGLQSMFADKQKMQAYLH
jgi:hypothetical protein